MRSACCCASWRDRLREDGSVIDEVVRGYGRAAAMLLDPYDAIDSERLYAPVLDLFPTKPARFADIGAGTGRDAAWLAGKGHRVTAIEPVAEFRTAGLLRHPDLAITWCDDRLPGLPVLRQSQACFDGVFLSGVWQHLTEDERETAAASIAAIAASEALVVMSLRHGPGAPDRPVIGGDPARTIEAAERVGLALLRQVSANSLGAANRWAGVHWTWLAFRR